MSVAKTTPKLSASRAAEIEAKRAGNPLSLSALPSDGTFRLMCPVCDKPNALSVRFCTGCGFGLSERDVARVSENVFLDLVRGEDIGAHVWSRKERVIVLEDRFPAADYHLQVSLC
eukprot:TRINITY_DN51637_c0_g1_i1.p1 TRINITY_DN51637_c0_g1~~TRINITY_DN51637_c0_g1_i1.p1  ORF type:complete len:116 (+),score=7.13 TRINITY_DN51637_c0_g1_i1:75-422(+)